MKTLAATTFLDRAMLALIVTVTLSSCSDRQAPAAQATTEAAAEQDPATNPQDVVKANASPGGISTAYFAYFDAGQLKRITETRKPGGSEAAKGEYIFYGARLTQYRGTSLNSDASIELNFDMQGVLTSSNTSAGNTIGDEESGAIRNRAQLLRSVALARRSTQLHMAH